MAIGTTAAIVGGVSALSAGLSAFGRENPEYQYGRPGALETSGFGAAQSGLAGFQAAMQNQGQTYLGMLGQYAKTGAIPDAGDIARSQQFAGDVFRAREVSQQQAFMDQLTQANRQAALSGRGINDPILRAKLAQEQTRQGDVLAAERTGFAAQFAQQQPLQRLGFAGQAAESAMSMQKQLAALGYEMGAGERQNRMQMAENAFRQQSEKTSFAQGLGGAMQGGLMGFGAGAQIDAARESQKMWGDYLRRSGPTLNTGPMQGFSMDSRGNVTANPQTGSSMSVVPTRGAVPATQPMNWPLSGMQVTPAPGPAPAPYTPNFVYNPNYVPGGMGGGMPSSMFSLSNLFGG